MVATPLHRIALAAMIAGLAAAPALAQSSGSATAQPAPKPTATPAAGGETATVARADKPPPRDNSRSAKQVWRDRQHLSKAR